MFGDGLLQPSLNFKKEREVKGLLQTQDRLVISSESLNFENVTDLKLRNGRRKKNAGPKRIDNQQEGICSFGFRPWVLMPFGKV